MDHDVQGFPKKTPVFSKIKNVPDLLSDDKEGKIIYNIDFKHFSNRASFLGNPVSICEASKYIKYTLCSHHKTKQLFLHLKDTFQ